jgi:hypothetical protein
VVDSQTLPLMPPANGPAEPPIPISVHLVVVFVPSLLIHELVVIGPVLTVTQICETTIGSGSPHELVPGSRVAAASPPEIKSNS